jgi:DNA polymerase I-like protein with 3'-5' exonuclease and polymerase domains
VDYVHQTGYASHDFETTGLEYYNEAEFPISIAISFQVGSSWVVPLYHSESPFLENWEEVLKFLGKEIFEDPTVTKVAWNMKFEYKWLKRFNIELLGRYFDGMLAKHLLDEEKPHGLKEMVNRYLPEFAGYERMVDNTKLITTSLEDMAEYNALDADLTLRLFLFFEAKLINLGFYKLFRNLFSPLTKVLGKCEYYGIPVDRPYLESLVIKYHRLIGEAEEALRENRVLKRYEKKTLQAKRENYIEKLEEEIEELTNATSIANRKKKMKWVIEGQYERLPNKDAKLFEPLNFSSPQQLVDLFYKSEYGFEFPILEYTKPKKGTVRQSEPNPSTSEETILKLREYDEYGFIDALLEYRGLTKLYSTYIEGILNILPSDDRLRCSYLIHGTVTGRLSSRNPNMQNIPRMCISQDQLILTHRGYIPVGEVVPLNPGVIDIPYLMVKTHTGRWCRALQGVNKGEEEMFEVELTDGTKITCTKGHRMWTTKGWKSLREIMDKDLTLKVWKLQ